MQIWKGCHRRGTPSRKRVGFAALGVRLPPLPLVEVWPSWQGSAVLRRRATSPRRFESCCLRFVPAWSSGQDARLLIARRRFEACRRSLAPVVEAAMTPGPQPGTAGSSPAGGLYLAVGETATPPASGAGDRRFDSCRPDLRGRGAAVLASLMSSRPWVRIPPAPSPRKIAACGGSIFRGFSPKVLVKVAPAKPAPPAERRGSLGFPLGT